MQIKNHSHEKALRIRVKTSGVFRNDFAGKANRERIEQLLGQRHSICIEASMAAIARKRELRGGEQRIEIALITAAVPQSANADAMRKSMLRDGNQR